MLTNELYKNDSYRANETIKNYFTSDTTSQDYITVWPLYNGHLGTSLLYRGVLYVEVILYSKECNWYTRCCPLNGGVRYRECPLRETIL